MTTRNTLVTETAVEFKHLWKPGDQQALEVKLRSDAEIKVHPKGVVMGLEGFGGSTSRDGLHHRGLDLEKTALIEESTDFTDDQTALAERLARRSVGDQIKVALAVTGLGILHTVPLIRQWSEGLGENGKPRNFDARFAGARRETLPLDSQEITDVELGGDREGRLVEFLAVEINLHPSPDIREIKEATFAHIAISGDASG